MSNLKEFAGREVMAFHRDEEGLNTVESMLLLGAGVLIMIGLMTWLKPNVTTRVDGYVKNLLQTYNF